MNLDNEILNVDSNSLYDGREVQEHPNGDIEFIGLETGKTVKIRHEGDKVIFKKAGHNYRAGIGLTAYAHPRYLVGSYVDGIFICIVDIEYSRENMKKAKELSEEYYNKV